MTTKWICWDCDAGDCFLCDEDAPQPCDCDHGAEELNRVSIMGFMGSA